MAIIRTMANAKRRGRVGDTTYYVRNGEQVARQARNNSNYGTEASRTPAQLGQRVKWANLINVYKACAFWITGAYESKSANQTDYNRFMQLNLDSAKIYLTKALAENGTAVLDNFILSQGSLMSIGITNPVSGDYLQSSLIAGSTTPTTLGAAATAIIAENPGFSNGDNIALVMFRNIDDGEFGATLECTYREWTLDTSSTAALNTVGLFEFASFQGASNTLSIAKSNFTEAFMPYTGLILIHTRMDGGLKTSTQRPYIYSNSLIQQYSSDTAYEAAVESYRVQEEVLLAPGE